MFSSFCWKRFWLPYKSRFLSSNIAHGEIHQRLEVLLGTATNGSLFLAGHRSQYRQRKMVLSTKEHRQWVQTD